MAKRIQGITIEIDGNATALTKSLKNVDSQLYKTQSNLKDIDRLLKFNPGNTELLAQKQKNLKDAVEQTKQRLSELKAVSKDSVKPEEWDAVQREIAETEGKLKTLEDQYKSFGSVSAQQLAVAGEKLQSVGNGMKTVGEGMTKYVTAPIMAIGAASGKAWTEVDAGLDTITQKTGATGDALDEMGESMKNIAKTIPTDFETAGNAIGEVNTRFGLTGQALEDLSGQFVKFAQLNNTDVSTSIDLVQQAMSAFGMDASQAGEMLDILNKVGQNTGISVDTLAQSMVTNSAALHEMGFGASEAAQFLGEMETAGIDSTTMMSGLKKALANAAAEGKPLDQALQELQASMEGASTNTEAMNMASDLFGAKAGPAIAEACRNGVINFNDLGAAVQGAGGSVSETFEATLDPADRFQTTLNQLKEVGYELAEAAMPMIGQALETVTGVVQSLKEKWDELSPSQQEFIVKAALVAAAIGPVLVALGSVVSTIGTILTFAPAIAAFLAGPIAPIAALVAIIGGLAVAIIANFDKIKAEWDKFKQQTADLVNSIKQAFQNMVQGISNAWNNIKSTVSAGVQAVKQFFDNMKSGITSAVNGALSTVRSVFNSIKTAITDPINTAKNLVNSAMQTIRNILSGHLSFPHISLPHFSITGSFSLAPPRVPHLSVSWYRKAYDQPYIFTRPTIVGDRGFGDGPGAEIVYGRNQLLRDIAQAKGGDQIVINVYPSPGMNESQLATKVSDKLSQFQRQQEAVYA